MESRVHHSRVNVHVRCVEGALGLGGHVVIGVVRRHHADVIPSTDFFPSGLNDEEDKLLSSIPRIRRENISLVKYRSNSFFQWERFSVKSQQLLFFVVLLLPSIGMQNLLHSVLTHILRADLREFLFHCCSNSSQTCLIHEKF